MSAFSIVPIDCVQYGLQEIRGLLYLGSSPVDKGSFILADDMDGDDRRDQGSKDDCRGMRLKRKKSHTDSNSRPTFATTTIAVESPGKAGI